MPEASARKLRETRDDAPSDERVRLRVVDAPSGPRDTAAGLGVTPREPSEFLPTPPRGPAPGRPHPRSRIRPDLEPPAPVVLRSVTDTPTVKITGHTAPRPARRRRAAPAGPRPDRLARWAVLLGLFMAFMAAATARADTPDASAAAPVAGHSASR
jgi:hypothetical protein